MGFGPRVYIDMGYVRKHMERLSRQFTIQSSQSAFAYPEWDAILGAATSGLDCKAIKVYDAAPASGEPAKYANQWRWLANRDFVKLKIRPSLEPPLFTQKEVDVDLATDMISDCLQGKGDWFVLLSADRDFLPAIEKVQEQGCKVRLVHFERSAPGHVLARRADDVVDLDAATCLDIQTYKVKAPRPVEGMP